MVKTFPQEIENTREIIENMSEIIQNISDIFFATYTRVDFQVFIGRLFLSAKPCGCEFNPNRFLERERNNSYNVELSYYDFAYICIWIGITFSKTYTFMKRAGCRMR